jgi:hypothetical protein
MGDKGRCWVRLTPVCRAPNSDRTADIPEGPLCANIRHSLRSDRVLLAVVRNCGAVWFPNQLDITEGLDNDIIFND